MKLTFHCHGCGQALNIGHSQIGTVVRCPACDMNQPVITPLAKRFHAMRIAAVTLKVMGAIVGLALVIWVMSLTATYQLWAAQQVWKAILVLLVGVPCAFVAGLKIYAAGEGLHLLVDLEDNVRALRLRLEMARAERQPPPAPAPPQEQSQ